MHAAVVDGAVSVQPSRTPGDTCQFSGCALVLRAVSSHQRDFCAPSANAFVATANKQSGWNSEPWHFLSVFLTPVSHLPLRRWQAVSADTHGLLWKVPTCAPRSQARGASSGERGAGSGPRVRTADSSLPARRLLPRERGCFLINTCFEHIRIR